MSKNIHFWEFLQDIWVLKIVLGGTPSHLNKSMLHNQLEAGLEPSLQAECIHENLSTITTLKEWIEQVKKVDKCLHLKEKDIERSSSKNQAYMLPNDLLWVIPMYQTLRTLLPHWLPNSSVFQNLPIVKETCLGPIPDVSSARGSTLDIAATQVPAPFSFGRGYKTITKQANVNGQPAVQPSSSSSTKGKMIASLIEVVDSEDEEVITAFAPSAVLGNGTDSGEFKNMSTIAPLKCKHFV